MFGKTTAVMGKGWFESDDAYRERVAREASERTIEDLTGEAPSRGWFESDEHYADRIAKEASECTIEDSTGEAPSQGWFESDEHYADRISKEAHERIIEDLSGDAPSQRWFESDENYETRVRKEANETIVEQYSGEYPKKGLFESDHTYRSRISHEARELIANSEAQPSSDSSGSSLPDASTSATGAGWVLFVGAVLVMAVAGFILDSVRRTNGSHPVLSAATATDPSSGGTSIRQIDFLNFSYESGCSERDQGLGFPPVIAVVKGSWEQGKTGQNYISYSVDPPVYGHLLGGHAEQAVISADCFLGNGDDEEILVFGMSGGEPKLIQRLGWLDWAPDRDVYDISGVAIRNNHLVVTYTAGGNHAQPTWSVTRSFIWDGGKFMAGPATRKAYSPK